MSSGRHRQPEPAHGKGVPGNPGGERTRELAEQLHELQLWHAVMLDREDRVIELKREGNKLLGRIGEPPRYTNIQDEGGEK